MIAVEQIARKPIGLRALQSFAAIVRTGSATAAGKVLGMTQPGVSRLIAQLEADVGFELFYRDRGRLVPTKDALALAAEVELALGSFERVNSMIRDIATFSTGELRIVAPPSFSEGILPEIVAAFGRLYPGVRFSLDARSVETAKAMIATRVVDCGFMKLPVDAPDIATERMVSSGSVCVLTEDHPLAAHAVLDPRLLRGVPLVLLGSGRQWRAQIDQAFGAMGVRPTVAVETHTHGSACALATRGVGIGIVNALLARSYIRAPLIQRPFDPPIVHDYAFAVAHGASGRLTEAFREVARAHLGALHALGDGSGPSPVSM